MNLLIRLDESSKSIPEQVIDRMLGGERIRCKKCDQVLAFVESKFSIRLSDRGTLAVMGVTIEGEISGSLTCLSCHYTQIYNPIYGYDSMVFEPGQTFHSNREAKLGDA